ncbi:hypothetical protein LUX57_29140 [Actinomadura madurae]|nr:hypothetical protein [Actinomadura madurae]MCP9968734.1 hypothetical protein [Actinomadura madurae]
MCDSSGRSPRRGRAAAGRRARRRPPARPWPPPEDRLADLLREHRPQDHLLPAQRAGEPGVGERRGVEVGAQAQHRDAARRAQPVDDASALAEREHLLELVDDQDPPALRHRLARGAHLRRRPPRFQRRDQSGPQQRGLPGSGRSDEREHSAALLGQLQDRVQQLGRRPVPTEEPFRVLDLERLQSAVGHGAPGGRRSGCVPHADQRTPPPLDVGRADPATPQDALQQLRPSHRR